MHHPSVPRRSSRTTRTRVATLATRTGVATLAAALVLGAAPAPAATDPEVDAAVARGAAWLRSQQDPATGSLGSFGGDWAMTALAAAGVHPADVRAAAGAPSAQDHYFDVWAAGPGGTATDLERGILTAGAGGVQTSRISAEQNLVARLAELFDGRQIGSPAAVNDDIFGVLALHRAGAPLAVRRTIAAFIRANQTESGGWSFVAGAAGADPDMTGAGVAALCRAGAAETDPAVERALGYLRGHQDAASGGIASPFFGVNTDTTAWVVAGLHACGIDPGAWTTAAGRTPLDFLVSQQNADGSFQWRHADGRSDLYASQDAIRTLAGEDFSAPPPERPGGLPRFRTAPEVAAGTPVPLTLAIDHGDGAIGEGVVRLCRVTAPVGSTVAAVLRAAQTEATPHGCVSDVEAGERVDSLNGVAGRPGERGWEVLRNGAPAAADEAVGLGDMIAVAYVANRPAPEQPAPRPRLELAPPPPVQTPPLLRVSIASRRLVLRAGRVAASLVCPRGTGAAGCRGALSLRAHARAGATIRRITVARAAFAIPAGERRTIALRIPAARRRALRRLPVRRVVLLAATREPATGRIATTRTRLALATR